MMRGKALLAATGLSALCLSVCAAGTVAVSASTAKTFVFTGLGGSDQAAFDTACVDPFAKAHGLTPEDTDNASVAQIEIEEDAHDVTSNILLDATPGPAGKWGSLLEPINYKIVGRTLMPKSAQFEYAVGHDIYSTVLAYNATAYGNHPPTDWADYFNLKKFPGERGQAGVAYDGPEGQTELVQLAYQGTKEPKYPLSESIVTQEMNKIKGHVLYYNGAAQMDELLLSGQVDMEMIVSSHAVSSIESLPAGSPTWKIQWNQEQYAYDYLEIPKNAPDPTLDNEFIHYCMEKQPQIEYSELHANGPANPAAAAALPAYYQGIPIRSNLPSAHLKDATTFDQAWWTPSRSTQWTTFWEKYEISG